jgi:hypothetical protein
VSRPDKHFRAGKTRQKTAGALGSRTRPGIPVRLMATIPPHCKRFEASLVESAAEIAGHRGLYANRLTGPMLAVERQTRHCRKSWLQTLAANPGRKSWPNGSMPTMKVRVRDCP